MSELSSTSRCDATRLRVPAFSLTLHPQVVLSAACQTPPPAPPPTKPNCQKVGIVLGIALIVGMILIATSYEGRPPRDTAEAAVNRELAPLMGKGDGLYVEKVVRLDTSKLEFLQDDGTKILADLWLAQAEYANANYDASLYAITLKKTGEDGELLTNRQYCIITTDGNQFEVQELVDPTRIMKIGGGSFR